MESAKWKMAAAVAGRRVLPLLAFAAFTALAADPVVSGVTMTQDATTKNVTIGYTLSGADAIVTLDVTTNGVSIGGENLTKVWGDVNRKVVTGTRSIVWRPVMGTADMKPVVTAWRTDTPPDYMVIRMDRPQGATNVVPLYYANTNSIPGGFNNARYKTTHMIFRKCPAAEVVWRMGTPSSDGFFGADQVAHLVKLTHDFYIGVYPCTQGQFTALAGVGWRGRCRYTYSANIDWAVHPMESINYDDLRGKTAGAQWPTSGDVDAGSFFGVLRAYTGMNFDLPTEAQWEYACRAGTGTTGNIGVSYGTCWDEVSWINYNADGHTHEVGLKRPNAWNIYDMHGQVMEICRDWYGPYEFVDDETPVVDPEGAPSGEYRVARPAAFTNNHTPNHSGFRNKMKPSEGDMGGWHWNGSTYFAGFRVALEIE